MLPETSIELCARPTPKTYMRVMLNQYVNYCTLRAGYSVRFPNKENPIGNKSCSLETFYT